jgi:hypothetical protein
MDDLELIEKKAQTWMAEAKDLDSFAQAARVLHQVAEQRKMRSEAARAQSGESLPKGEARRGKVGFLIATLLPALAFVVTAGTFLYQMKQGNVATQAQEDSQWRSALEKIKTDSESAPIGALEMHSFFASRQYAKEARPVAAMLLESVDDRSVFDLVYFDLVYDKQHQNQEELITLARALTERLSTEQEKCMRAAGKQLPPPDGSFAEFLKAPEHFCDDEKDLEKIDADTAKLDSVSQGLSDLWKNRHLHMSPAKQDLAGVAFLNGDFSGLDFRHAVLRGAGFYGDCHLTGAQLDQRESVDHCGGQESNKLAAALKPTVAR